MLQPGLFLYILVYRNNLRKKLFAKFYSQEKKLKIDVAILICLLYFNSLNKNTQNIMKKCRNVATETTGEMFMILKSSIIIPVELHSQYLF